MKVEIFKKKHGVLEIKKNRNFPKKRCFSKKITKKRCFTKKRILKKIFTKKSEFQKKNYQKL